MIFAFGNANDQIVVFVDSEPIIVDLARFYNDHEAHKCAVTNCNYGHLYGYHFCSYHQWVLPIPAEQLPDGFQVGLINYWKWKKIKTFQTHQYKETKQT